MARRVERAPGVIVAFGALAIGAGMLLAFSGRLEPDRPLEFAALILAAIVTSLLAKQQPLSFIIDFTSLLLFGPGATMIVAVAGSVDAGLH